MVVTVTLPIGGSVRLDTEASRVHVDTVLLNNIMLDWLIMRELAKCLLLRRSQLEGLR